MRRTKMQTELLEALQELVDEGEIVAVDFINPKTGKLQKRYYHKQWAPKSN